MYYQNYEDYMRSVLGYPVDPTYDNYIIQNRDYNISYQHSGCDDGRFHYSGLLCDPEAGEG